MKLAFMGTPAFSVPILEALIGAGHEIAAVYSQPPRPAGRGQQEQPSPVHQVALSMSIPVRTPVSLKSADEQAAFAALDLDAAVVVAYGLILPPPILQAPRRGCFNVHASLLPRWRGAAPIHRAIQAGDAATGVCIMQMEVGLDTGPVLLSESIPIAPDDTTGALHDKLAALGARLMVETLARLDSLTPRPQPAEGVTYAHKIAKDEARIDWHKPAADIERLIRAMSPIPGAWFEANGQRIKIWKAIVTGDQAVPGIVLDDDLTIACGDGALKLISVQRAGKGVMSAGELLRGFPIARGTLL